MVAHESGLSHPAIALDRRAWRIVSEDSIHPMASLSTAVHPFPESKNLVVVLVAQTTGSEKDNCLLPEPEVLRLHSHDRKSIEERHDSVGQIGKSVDLPIPTSVSRPSERPTTQCLSKEVQWLAIMLRHVEGG
jgi:hypothetical protein